MRNVYSRWLGCPVDAAAIGETMRVTAGRLREAMAERLVPFAPAEYRRHTSSEVSYGEVALDPRVEDRAFLAAAITRCRIEEAAAPATERARLAETRSRIFDKLAALDPDAIQEPPTVEVLWDHPDARQEEERSEQAAAAPVPLPAEAVARRKRIDKIVGAVSIGGFVVAVAAYFAWQSWSASHPPLYVYNSHIERAAIHVDGKHAATLEPSSHVDLELKVGSHRLSAMTPDGRVLEDVTVTVTSGAPQLWAPASRDRVCFVIETVVYGPGSLPEPRLLDPNATLWPLLTSIDYAFQDPPKSLEVRDGDRLLKRVLAAAPCDELD
jgi:hypothetical protein